MTRRTFVEWLRREPLLLVALLLAVVSSVFAVPRWQAIDWDVLIALLNLMVVLRGLESLRLLDAVSIALLKRAQNERRLSQTLVWMTFFASMLITNDVALLTFVPLAIVVGRRAGFNPAYLIILQTLAANVGSSLTPMGNPQNLFLYATFQVPTAAFFGATFPVIVLGGVAIWSLLRRVPDRQLEFELAPVVMASRFRLACYLGLFLLATLAILRIVPYSVALVVTLAFFLLRDRESLRQVDYPLLGTFVALFVFVDNLSRVPLISHLMQSMLDTPKGPYLSGIFLSQGISNVPAAILLSGFTADWRQLLLGVSVGGLGTLIASLASVISFRLYAKAYPDKVYLARFHRVNFAALVLLGGLLYWLV